MDKDKALRKIMDILDRTEGDIESILEELDKDIHKEGYNEGHKEGYNKGCDEGYNKGYEEGNGDH